MAEDTAHVPDDHVSVALDEDALEGLLDESPVTAVAEAVAAQVQGFKRRDDPALPHYPRGLVLDLCLKTAPVAELLQAYRMTPETYKKLVEHPVFRQEVRAMREKLNEEGFSFRVKAQAQAEAYLHRVWQMVHDNDTPASVRADLIKSTIKWAALEPKPEQQGSQVAVNIDMRQVSDDDLNARVMQIVMKQARNGKSGEVFDG